MITATEVRATDIAPLGLMRMQNWLSPMLPTGAFSFSHALEAAVGHGLVSDAATLVDWLDADLRHGTGWNDAVFFKCAWDAARACDHADLMSVAEQAAVYRGTAELALEAAEQGRASMTILNEVWDDPVLRELSGALARGDVAPVAAVVLATRMAREGVALEVALPSFLQAYCSNLVAAAVRLVRIGQTAGQRVVRQLEESILDVCEKASVSTLRDLGTCAVMVDLMSIEHETQNARLFRS